MWVLAGALGALLLAPHLLPRTQLSPLVGIGMWWSVLAFRLAIAVCVALVVLLYLPASQLFELLTRWCLHVSPIIVTHLSGHRLGDAASLVPALVLVLSVGSALLQSWRAGRSVRGWLRRSALGPGPQDSVIVDDPAVILAAAGMRERQVVVSAGALAGLDDAELAAGLQHEWGHVRRSHWLVTLSSSLLLSVSRFLPGGGSAFRNLQFHLERDADRYAVRSTGDPLALASAICKMAAARPMRPHGSATFALDGGYTTDRVRLLLDDSDDFGGRRMPRLLGSALAIGTAVLAVGLLAAAAAVAGDGVQMAHGVSTVVSCV